MIVARVLHTFLQMHCCCMYCFQHFVAESVFAVCHFPRTVCGLVNITSAACCTHTLIHALTHSWGHSSTRLLFLSFRRSLLVLLVPSSPTHSLAHSLTHSLARSLARSLTHSLTLVVHTLQGFVTTGMNNKACSLNICQMPAQVQLETPWPLQRVAMHATPHRVSFYPEAGLYVVLLSQDGPHKEWLEAEEGGDMHAAYSYALAKESAKIKPKELGYEVFY